MVYAMAIVVQCIMAQTDAVFYGAVPETAATFKIRFQNDENEYVGGVRMDNEWVRDPERLGAGLRRIEVVIDTPWNPQPSYQTVLNRLRECIYEPSALRRRRLEQGWDAAGYTFIDTAEGRRPVQQKEIALAGRAREMAAAIEKRAQPQSGTISEDDTDDAPGVTAAPPGWAWQWGGHLLVLLFGIVLAGAILKKMVI